ncbi:FecCD family ABC transporter permease [Nocardia sp. NPDC056064]|uniref:FecCD family ABC transporter permease n=1 Tax=Nocardia sp. NPDC056064 TaxID=3345701 RepID=UPI0035E2F863
MTGSAQRPGEAPTATATPSGTGLTKNPTAGTESARSLGAVGSRGRVLGLLVAALILAVALALSLAVGSRGIALGTVWDALWHYDGSPDHMVMHTLRVPRTVLGLLAGIGLGVAGALIQAMTRNPLADPGILGVNAGAAFFVALAVAVFGFTGIWSYVWFAFLGAVVVTVAVYALGARGRDGATPIRITLSGVAIGAVLSGVTTGLMMIDPATFDHLRFWNAGSIAGARPDVVWAVSGFVVAGTLLAFVVARPLNAIALGDDLARSLGVDIAGTRRLGIVAVTLLCGAATAAAGPIGFVGLMIPHVARWLVGPDQRWILCYTVLGAPTLLLVADVLGRIVVRPAELQVGIVTAFVGAPVLVVLVRRQRASGL